MDAPLPRAPAGIRLLRGGPLLRLRSDEQLLLLFRAGSDDAFQVIHDRYRQRLFTYSRQMLGGSSSDAEDAMQDVFLRAYGALRADDRPVSVRAWLYRVAHNRCIDQLRRPRPATVELHEELAASTLNDPLTEASRREDLARLVTDVGRLPEQQRSALLLREMEGLTYVELADALDCSIPAVKSLLVRARMGLVEQAEARALSCSDIRDDLDQAHDRGVRMTGRARRHLRDCAACRSYRDTVKGVSTGLHSLTPSTGPWALLMKLLGIGSAGSGAAAGGAATVGAGGGSVALIGGGTAATASKVAAMVCCAAVVGGGAAEVQERIVPAEKRQQSGQRSDSAPSRAAGIAPAAVAAAHALDRTGPRPELARAAPAKDKAPRRKAAVRSEAAEESLPVPAPGLDGAAAGELVPVAATPTASEQTGGAQAPDEPIATAPPPGTTPSGTTGTPPGATGTTAPGTGATGAGTGTTGTGTTAASPASPGTTEPARDTGAPAGAAAPAPGSGGAGSPAPSGPGR